MTIFFAMIARPASRVNLASETPVKRISRRRLVIPAVTPSTMREI